MSLKNNKGLTLIELMAVIAIMSIVGAGMIIGVYSSSGYRAKKAVRAIEQTLSESREQALSKSSAWMELTVDANGKYVLKNSYSSDIVLDGNVTISYHVRETNTQVDVSATPLILTYDRASGAFSDIKASYSAKDAGTGIVTYTPLSGDENNRWYCDWIKVTQGSREYMIRLVPETGRYE